MEVLHSVLRIGETVFGLQVIVLHLGSNLGKQPSIFFRKPHNNRILSNNLIPGARSGPGKHGSFSRNRRSGSGLGFRVQERCLSVGWEHGVG